MDCSKRECNQGCAACFAEHDWRHVPPRESAAACPTGTFMRNCQSPGVVELTNGWIDPSGQTHSADGAVIAKDLVACGGGNDETGRDFPGPDVAGHGVTWHANSKSVRGQLKRSPTSTNFTNEFVQAPTAAAPPVSECGKTIHLGAKAAVAHSKFSGEKFYHYLLNAFPRIITALPHLNNDSKILIACDSSGKPSPFMVQSVAMLGVAHERLVCAESSKDGVFRPETTCYTANTFVWPSAVDCSGLSVEIAGRLRGRPAFSPTPSRGNTVLFQVRSDYRRLANHDAVFAATKVALAPKRGLNVREIDSAKLSFKDQVDAYRRARCQVGPHGAGMSLMLFAPNDFGTAEISWADGYRNCFRGLALSLNQRSVWFGVNQDGHQDFDDDMTVVNMKRWIWAAEQACVSNEHSVAIDSWDDWRTK